MHYNDKKYQDNNKKSLVFIKIGFDYALDYLI